MLLALSIPSATGASDWWRPEGRISWDWQLTEPIDLDRDVAMFDLDLFDTEAGVVAELKSRGVRTVCYLSAGSWGDWRQDAIRLRPCWRNHVWAYDFVQARTHDGRVFRMLTVIDE